MSTTRDEKISSIQKQTMVTYMEGHLDFCYGKLLGGEGKIKSVQLWAELVKQLNEIEGSKKTVVKWQRAWVDVKNKVKNKARKIKLSITADTGLPIVLNDLEKRVLKLLRKEPLYNTESNNVPLESGIEYFKSQTELASPEVVMIDEDPFKEDILTRLENPQITTSIDNPQITTSIDSPQITTPLNIKCNVDRTGAVNTADFSEIGEVLNDTMQEISSTLTGLLHERVETNILLRNINDTLLKLVNK